MRTQVVIAPYLPARGVRQVAAASAAAEDIGKAALTVIAAHVEAVYDSESTTSGSLFLNGKEAGRFYLQEPSEG